MSEAHEPENGDHYHENNSPDYSQMAPHQVDDSNTTYIYEAPSVAVAIAPSSLAEANGHSHPHHLKRAVVVTTDPRDRIVASENTNGTTTVYVEASDVEELRYAGAHVRYEEEAAYQGRYEYHPAGSHHGQHLSGGGSSVHPDDIKVEMVRSHQHQQQHQHQEIHIYEQNEESNRHGATHQQHHHQHQSDVPKAHYTNLEPAHQNYYLPDGFQPPSGFPYFTSSKDYPIFNPVSSNSVLYKGE